MKILNALILVIYAFGSVFLSSSANAGTGTTYAVQIMASQKQLPTTDAVFKGITDVQEETFTMGPVKYKYTTGWTSSWTEVKATWQKMKDAGFTGAFIVTYNSGNRVVKNTTTAAATNNNTTTTRNTPTAPTTTETNQTTTSITEATPNTTSGTTIFTTADGKSVSMTTKKVTNPTGTANQYETTTTTGPASTNPWNTTWNTTNTPTTTTDTKTTANGNTVTTTTKKVTTTTMWVNPDGTTTTTPPATTNTNWNTTTAANTTTTPNETNTAWNNTTANTKNTTTTPTNTTANTTATTTRVHRGYGEKLTQADPTFPGGDDAMYVWIRNNLSYVLQTQSTGEWKHGYLVFTVDKTGKAMNPMMMTSISKEVDAAAIKMVNNMPNWNPATVAGNPVEKQFIMPLDCFIPASVPTTSTK